MGLHGLVQDSKGGAGRRNLDHGDLERAALLPTLSIMSAAFRLMSRIISMSRRASPIRYSHTDWSASRLPKATRDSSRSTIFSRATSVAPSARMQ